MKTYFRKKDLVAALRLVQNRNPKLAVFNLITPHLIPQPIRQGLKMDGIVLDNRQAAAFAEWKKGGK